MIYTLYRTLKMIYDMSKIYITHVTDLISGNLQYLPTSFVGCRHLLQVLHFRIHPHLGGFQASQGRFLHGHIHSSIPQSEAYRQSLPKLLQQLLQCNHRNQKGRSTGAAKRLTPHKKK